MIRAGLPQPLLTRLRQHWDRLCLQWEGRISLIREQWTNRREKPLPEGVSPSPQELVALDRENLQTFADAHDDLIEILCAAAHAEAPDAYRDKHHEARALYASAYAPLKRALYAHWQATELAIDPFEALAQDDIVAVIESPQSFETLIAMRRAIDSLQSTLKTD